MLKYLENEFGCTSHLERAADALEYFGAFADPDSLEYVKREITEAHEKLGEHAGMDPRSTEFVEVINETELNALRRAYSELAKVSYTLASNDVAEVVNVLTVNPRLDEGKEIRENFDQRIERLRGIIANLLSDHIVELRETFQKLKDGKRLPSGKKPNSNARKITQIHGSPIHTDLEAIDTTFIDTLVNQAA